MGQNFSTFITELVSSNPNKYLGSIKNPDSCSTRMQCPKGFNKDKDVCYAGWSSSCDENCYKDRCKSENGTWVNVNPAVSPYKCKPAIKQADLNLYSGNWYDGKRECFDNEGKYYCNLTNVGSLKLRNNFMVVLYSGNNLDGEFMSVLKDQGGGNLINAKTVLLLKNIIPLTLSLSSKTYNEVGSNFWLTRGLYPDLSNVYVGSYKISSVNPFYKKESNEGIMFYSEKSYLGKSIYLGTKSPTQGQLKLGFIPKSAMIFKADKIYLYKDGDLTGKEITVNTVAYPDMHNAFGKNKVDIVNTQSISIPEGIIAFLYTEKNFKGNKLILSAGAYNLPNGWSDHVKSAHFFTLSSLKTYQENMLDQARNNFLNKFPHLNTKVDIAPGWEQTSYNIVAKNILRNGNCYIYAKNLEDIGVHSTTPNEFVLEFYLGLLTKDEASEYAKTQSIPYFGYVVNPGYNQPIKKDQKLNFFGGYTLNSDNSSEKLPQSVFGTHLHVYKYDFAKRMGSQICSAFVKQANIMNQYARDMKYDYKLYEEKLRLENIKKSI